MNNLRWNDPGYIKWLGPVPTIKDLPESGNHPGDARIAGDNMMMWDGAQWVPIEGDFRTIDLSKEVQKQVDLEMRVAKVQREADEAVQEFQEKLRKQLKPLAADTPIDWDEAARRVKEEIEARENAQFMMHVVKVWADKKAQEIRAEVEIEVDPHAIKKAIKEWNKTYPRSGRWSSAREHLRFIHHEAREKQFANKLLPPLGTNAAFGNVKDIKTWKLKGAKPVGEEEYDDIAYVEDIEEEDNLYEPGDPDISFSAAFKEQFGAAISNEFFNIVEAQLAGNPEFYQGTFQEELKAIGNALERVIDEAGVVILKEIRRSHKAAVKEAKSTTAADSSDVALLMAKVERLESETRVQRKALRKAYDELKKDQGGTGGAGTVDLGGGFVVDRATFEDMKDPAKALNRGK